MATKMVMETEVGECSFSKTGASGGFFQKQHVHLKKGERQHGSKFYLLNGHKKKVEATKCPFNLLEGRKDTRMITEKKTPKELNGHKKLGFPNKT